MCSVCGREGTSLLSAPQLMYVLQHSDTWTENCRMVGDAMAMQQCSYEQICRLCEWVNYQFMSSGWRYS